MTEDQGPDQNHHSTQLQEKPKKKMNELHWKLKVIDITDLGMSLKPATF